MTAARTDETLRMSLESLETALATPILSGELVDWVAALRSAWDCASEVLRSQYESVHAKQLEEMSEVDPEMLARVERLRVEDKEIQDDGENFQRHLTRIAEQAPNFERDEAKIKKHVSALVDDGLAFVQRVRKQEVALQTWFVEAFNRDRGVAD